MVIKDRGYSNNKELNRNPQNITIKNQERRLKNE